MAVSETPKWEGFGIELKGNEMTGYVLVDMIKFYECRAGMSIKLIITNIDQ